MADADCAGGDAEAIRLLTAALRLGAFVRAGALAGYVFALTPQGEPIAFRLRPPQRR